LAGDRAPTYATRVQGVRGRTVGGVQVRGILERGMLWCKPPGELPDDTSYLLLIDDFIANRISADQFELSYPTG
jgi:hypothetical protein